MQCYTNRTITVAVGDAGSSAGLGTVATMDNSGSDAGDAPNGEEGIVAFFLTDFLDGREAEGPFFACCFFSIREPRSSGGLTGVGNGEDDWTKLTARCRAAAARRR